MIIETGDETMIKVKELEFKKRGYYETNKWESKVLPFDFSYVIEKVDNVEMPWRASRSFDINCFAWANTYEKIVAAVHEDLKNKIEELLEV